MTEIFTANTVEEAKAFAAKKFGKSESEIKFEVLDEGKKGFFGIGKTEAKVRATFNETPAKAAAEPVKADAKAETAAADKKAEKPAQSAPAPAAEKKAAEPVKKAEAVREEHEKKEQIPDEEYSIENFTLIEDEALVDPKVKLARDYITSIFAAMGVKAEYKIYQNETGAIINIDSDNNGTVIGRRGETLDAVQYLCSIIANKGDKDYFRITIDCFGYRSKRKETLEHLAAKVSKSVLRSGRSQALEPMNPYERRVIHSAVSKIEGVSSRSVGEEPYRKIIISSNNPRKDNRRRDNRRGDRRDRRPRDFERKPVDLSTSFEKDYKRPKPEDNIEGGLYGKIEL